MPAVVPNEPFGPPFVLLGVFGNHIGILPWKDDYKHDQLVDGVQECYRSVVIQYGYILILMDEDNFRHQQFCVAVVVACEYLIH